MMALADVKGRAYALKSVLKAGMLVQVDDGFTCLKPYSRRVVHKAKNGLYIKCREGRHYLSGQLKEDAYIGIYPAPAGRRRVQKYKLGL